MTSSYSEENPIEGIEPLSTMQLHLNEIDQIVADIDRIRARLKELNSKEKSDNVVAVSTVARVISSLKNLVRLENHLDELSVLNARIRQHDLRLREIHSLYVKP